MRTCLPPKRIAGVRDLSEHVWDQEKCQGAEQNLLLPELVEPSLTMAEVIGPALTHQTTKVDHELRPSDPALRLGTFLTVNRSSPREHGRRSKNANSTPPQIITRLPSHSLPTPQSPE